MTNHVIDNKLYNEIVQESLYDKCSIFGKLLHYWNFTFYISNFKKELSLKDIPKCSKDDLSDKLTNEFENYWNLELEYSKLNNKKPSLIRTIIKVFHIRLLFNFILPFLQQLALIIQAILMGNLIKELNKDHLESKKYLWLNAMGMIFCQLIHVNCFNIYGSRSLHYAMKLKIALTGLMYKKILKLNKSAFLSTSSGTIINLIANDINKLEWTMHFMPFPIVSLFVIIIVIFILWTEFTYSVLIGVLVLFIILPIQILMGNFYSNFCSKATKLTDERIKLMNEFIPAIKIIKMYCWENKFAQKINECRKKEIAKIRAGSYCFAINLGFFYSAAKVVIYSCLISYVLFGNILNSESIYMAFALLNQMSFLATLSLPYFLKQSANGLVATNRIEKFLLSQEIENSSPNKLSPLYKNESYIKIVNLFGTYDHINKSFKCDNKFEDENENNLNKRKTKKSKQVINKNEIDYKDEKHNYQSNYKIILRDINFEVLSGELMTIVGSVGSGKTSILMAILNEINSIDENSIDIKGRISFACQDAWTFAGTIRDNVLFGLEFDEQKYEQVIKVCSLKRDLALFPQGDQTIIGDRGVSLSGGQRARINLARALYYDADIYLLDDPLSAVDPHVAKHIFKEAIQGYLKDKIVILVTHQLQFIKNLNKILLIDNGMQLAYGDFNTVSASEIEFTKFINTDKNEPNQSIKSHSSLGSLLSIGSNSVTPIDNTRLSLDSTSIDIEIIEQLKEKMKQQKEEDDEKNKKRQTIKEVSTLQFTSKIYYVYLKLGLAGYLGPCVIFSFILAQIIYSFADYFLSLWVNSEQKRNFKINNSRNQSSIDKSFIDYLDQKQSILIYSGIILCLFIISLTKSILFFKFCLTSSIKLHNRLFKKVVGSPIQFFETNPIGILLTRVSRDTGIVDEVLPSFFYDSVDDSLVNIGIAIMMILLNLYLIIPIIFLSILIIVYRNFYLQTAKYVRMLEGISKSPLIQHISSTINGLVSIRAYKQQNRFNKKFNIFANDHSSCYFLYIQGVRWFVYVLDSIQTIFLIGVLVVVICFAEYMNSTTIGLIVSSALIFGQKFQFMIKNFTEVEIQLTSVERLDQYSNLPQESQLESEPDKRPHKKWPTLGSITFKNVTMRYFEDEEPILRNLNFTINAKDKVGVVGRTGAGKSSLISALFRMNEYEGEILIDGVNIKEIGLHDLRKKISIIPQESILFTGTVRSNLDPLDEIKDDRILWDALRATQLDKTIEKMENGLESIISDSGSNFSSGQKQLICLARAILRGNRILVLDEATANCDPKTDELIQSTIRNVFKDTTLITVAHRLNTIIDSDKILVMDSGEVKEFDTPYNLLKDSTTTFSSLVDATGKESSRFLRKMAMINQKDQYLKEEL